MNEKIINISMKPTKILQQEAMTWITPSLDESIEIIIKYTGKMLPDNIDSHFLDQYDVFYPNSFDSIMDLIEIISEKDCKSKKPTSVAYIMEIILKYAKTMIFTYDISIQSAFIMAIATRIKEMSFYEKNTCKNKAT
ncbi:MAG: hypothetical protein ACTSRG_12900 [Candidatus Helarchaeota archaeon]